LRIACGNAYLFAAGWNSDAALELATYLANSMNAVVDWDEGAGEGWVHAYAEDSFEIVSTTIPLVFARCGVVAEDDLPKNTVIIFTESFGSDELSCSLETLSKAFAGYAEFNLLDPEGFSVQDLWFSTV
jgi:hypothetical protein